MAEDETRKALLRHQINYSASLDPEVYDAITQAMEALQVVERLRRVVDEEPADASDYVEGWRDAMARVRDALGKEAREENWQSIPWSASGVTVFDPPPGAVCVAQADMSRDPAPIRWRIEHRTPSGDYVCGDWEYV